MPNVLKTINTQIKLSEASPEIIKAVQQCLNITVDGICGVQTLLSFYGFKKRYSLAEPDYLGATTAKKLLEISTSKIVTEGQAETIFGRQITTAQLNDLNSCLQRFEINTPSRLRHFMSQIAHESCGLKYLKELATGDAYEYRSDLGNVKQGDGRRFKGGGALQVTGRANYQALCNYLGDPRVMEGCNYVAHALPFTASGHWWHCNNLNQMIDNGATVEQVTRRVNGGYNGLDDRKRYYAIASKVIR
jgi:putative chitinase